MQLYCNSLSAYKRLLTREVSVGSLLLGNGHPIRLQTMTTTDIANKKMILIVGIATIKPAEFHIITVTKNCLNISMEIFLLKKQLKISKQIHGTMPKGK